MEKTIRYNFCFLKIRQTKSNIFVTLTDFKGQVILKTSAGIIKFSGKKKRTDYVVESVVKHMINLIKTSNIKIGILSVQIFGLLNKYSFRRSVQILDQYKIDSFVNIMNIVKYAHNGMKLKKKKRL